MCIRDRLYPLFNWYYSGLTLTYTRVTDFQCRFEIRLNWFYFLSNFLSCWLNKCFILSTLFVNRSVYFFIFIMDIFVLFIVSSWIECIFANIVVSVDDKSDCCGCPAIVTLKITTQKQSLFVYLQDLNATNHFFLVSYF